MEYFVLEVVGVSVSEDIIGHKNLRKPCPVKPQTNLRGDNQEFCLQQGSDERMRVQSRERKARKWIKSLG